MIVIVFVGFLVLVFVWALRADGGRPRPGVASLLLLCVLVTAALATRRFV